MGHIGYVSAIVKSRIDPKLKRQAEAVLEEIGLKPRAALELFYKQIVKRRAILFPVQADSPELVRKAPGKFDGRVITDVETCATVAVADAPARGFNGQFCMTVVASSGKVSAVSNL